MWPSRIKKLVARLLVRQGPTKHFTTARRRQQTTTADTIEIPGTEILDRIFLYINEKKREAREGRVNFRSACRPARMSRHNQHRSVEKVRSLLGGTHAISSVKPSIDIIEGLSTGANMDASAPHLIYKWFTGHSRPCSCF